MQNKVVIITGASSGIGLALAHEIASLNAKIVIAARTIDKLLIEKPLLEAKGAEILCVKTDVTIESDCENLIKETIDRFGRVDVLINNAGISMRAMFDELDLSVIRRVMDVNFWGTVYCSKYAIKYLLEQKGSLVGVSSIAGYVGLPGRTGYSASKFAIHGFLNVLRTENLKKGLHVLIACPGFTASNIRNVALSKDGSAQGESPRVEEKMMSAEEVAKRIVKAIDKRKSTLNLTTQGKMTILMSKIFPSFTTKLIYNHMAKEENSPFK